MHKKYFVYKIGVLVQKILDSNYIYIYILLLTHLVRAYYRAKAGISGLHEQRALFRPNNHLSSSSQVRRVKDANPHRAEYFSLLFLHNFNSYYDK